MPWLTQLVSRTLESLNGLLDRNGPEHLRIARRGEMEAYLYLRNKGYRLVATNLRVPQSRGEIDLIGWEDGILCFVEVKTRTSEGLTPPDAAVDREKKAHILSVARRYVRRLPGNQPPPCRFDVVSIVLGDGKSIPDIRLQKGVFAWDADKPRRYYPRETRPQWRKRL